MIFRQLFDRESSTYTYLLGDETTREAVLIDPVRENVERDVALLEDLDLELMYVLETHVHADHVTSAGVLRQRLGATTVLSRAAGTRCADLTVDDGDVVTIGGIEIEARQTPGHTSGCVTYVTKDGEVPMAFTGDTLMIRGCGRTDFQQGDSDQLYESVWQKIFTLPDETRIYPGHDYQGRTMSTVGEEKRLNPRLGESRSKTEFIQIMAGLKLAYPKKIDEAVPANLQCGLAHDDRWAPIVRTDDGVPEVPTAWVRDHAADVMIVDVRRTDELVGELGAIPGAIHAPLDRLASFLAGWDKQARVVLVCRSGGRSGTAARQLEAAGFTHVASMHGGMLHWNRAGAPVVRDAATLG